MSKDISWAERTSWTEDDRLDFYRRLSRARKRNRASLLIRQGAVLATSAWPDGNHIALALLAEAEKHGLDEWTRAGFYRLLAECEWRRGDDDAALSAYRLAFAAQDAFPNLRLDLELSFVWEIATRHLRQVYDEALARLATVSEDAMTLAWPMNRYLFFGALALISADLGDSQGAARWARDALSAAGERKAPFPRHPRLGLVSSVDDDVLSVLTQLAVE